MVDSTRGCDALLGYVYFGKPVPHPFFPFHLFLRRRRWEIVKLRRR
jgi:hypothetical protein